MYDVCHIGGASPSILCGNDSAGLIGLLALSHMASNSRLFRPFLAASLYVLLESLEFDLFCSLSLGWEVCSVFLLGSVIWLMVVPGGPAYLPIFSSILQDPGVDCQNFLLLGVKGGAYG